MVFVSVRTLFVFIVITFIGISTFSSCTKTDQNRQTTDEACLLDSVVVMRTKNGAASLLQKIFYTYDEKNRWTKAQWYYEGKPDDYREYAYGNDGKISILTNFDPEGNKKEERKVFYDQQGRVGGFNLTTFAHYVNPVQKVIFLYEENRMTVIGLAGEDTSFKTIRSFENGNEIRAEYWNGATLKAIDSTFYSPQVFKHKYDADLSLVQSTMILHKNLIARRKVYDNILKVYQQDDNFSYEFTADGMVKKITTTTNFPVSNVAPIVSEYFYRCE